MTSSPRISLPLALLLVLTAGSLAYLIYFGESFPPRMAVHFNNAGEADGWMDRLKYIVIASSLAFMLPPFIIAGIGVMPRVLPLSMVNIPNRAYWLAPERRENTLSALLYHALWLGCIVEAFLLALFIMIGLSNPQSGVATLPSGHLVVVGVFVAAFLGWSWRFKGSFATPE